MERIFIQAGERSPIIDFDFPNHRLSMEGESYPENPAGFFGPLLEALSKYLKTSTEFALVIDIKMAYFNSSSAKALMNMFQLLEASAETGKPIRINWHYLEDDDTMEEFGEDFSEDFVKAEFVMQPIPST
jgi:hypothetical protein